MRSILRTKCDKLHCVVTKRDNNFFGIAALNSENGNSNQPGIIIEMKK